MRDARRTQQIKASTMDNQTNQSTATMQNYKLVRQGKPPLKFTGIIIGTGEIGNGQSGITIRIYRTKGNHYIPEIERPNARNEEFFRNAAHFRNPSEAIDWLKEGEDTLGKASQDAIEKACGNDKEFAAAWVEVVE